MYVGTCIRRRELRLHARHEKLVSSSTISIRTYVRTYVRTHIGTYVPRCLAGKSGQTSAGPVHLTLPPVRP